MNRDKRRRFEKRLIKKGYSKDYAKKAVSYFVSIDKLMNAGEKVKLKPESVAKYGNYKMKKWCEERMDSVFTLKKTDAYGSSLRVWTFEECIDDSVDWLFSELDLERAEG